MVTKKIRTIMRRIRRIRRIRIIRIIRIIRMHFMIRVIGLLLAVCLFNGYEAKAEKPPSHIVLFKHHEVSFNKVVTHKEKKLRLIETNKVNIEKLRAFLAARSLKPAALKNLWLVAGASLDLSPSVIEKLEKEPFVAKVLTNKEHILIKPLNTRLSADANLPWGLSAIKIPELRKAYPEMTGAGVKVGILDTGIQSRHEEFALTGSIDFKDFVNNIEFAYDDHGHGTHVAGTISGANVGIAPSASLFVGKIFTANGSGYDHMILEGMQWMYDPDGDPETDDGPRIVNNSWGLELSDGVHNPDDYLAYHRAVQTWVQGGIYPVFAAGNSGASPNGLPGGFYEVMAIAAHDVSYKIAPFSSRGPNLFELSGFVLSTFKPDFTAPGVDVLSSMPGNGYAFMSGTSMATPHMVGALALALQLEPSLGYVDAKKLLLQSVWPRADMAFGHGSLNAYRLIELLASSFSKEKKGS